MNRRTLLRNALALLGCASPAALLAGPVQRSWAEVAKEMQRSPVVWAIEPQGEVVQVVQVPTSDAVITDPSLWTYNWSTGIEVGE